MTTEHRPAHEPRHVFHEELDELRRSLVRMGSHVVENIRRAGEAMLESNLALIPEVRAADDVIDRMYLDLEYRTFETLARQQPMARDLRFLVASTRILYELERSGDLAVNCVNMLQRQEGFPEVAPILSLLSRLVNASSGLFAKAMDALSEMDAAAGYDLDQADDEVDDLVSLFYTEVGRRADEMGLETAISLSRVGRFLERIADHGVNIAENVTYIVTGSFPENVSPAIRDEA